MPDPNVTVLKFSPEEASLTVDAYDYLLTRLKREQARSYGPCRAEITQEIRVIGGLRGALVPSSGLGEKEGS